MDRTTHRGSAVRGGYNADMLDELRRVLEEEESDIAYALLFGSGARGALQATSDIDIAIELRSGTPRDMATLGRLAARLESAAERKVDLVLMDEAPSPLAYRIFRDGRIIVERDHAALVARKARAILEYLDFKPVEERCANGVLRAAAGRG
jgi:uncharacterized protein